MITDYKREKLKAMSQCIERKKRICEINSELRWLLKNKEANDFEIWLLLRERKNLKYRNNRTCKIFDFDLEN